MSDFLLLASAVNFALEKLEEWEALIFLRDLKAADDEMEKAEAFQRNWPEFFTYVQTSWEPLMDSRKLDDLANLPTTSSASFASAASMACNSGRTAPSGFGGDG